MQRSRFILILYILLLPFLARAAESEPSGTLFVRLGGMQTIQAVVEDVTARNIQDNRLRHYFNHVVDTPQHRADYKSKLVAYVCHAAGGPCKYTSHDMVTAPRGRYIAESAFRAIVQNLVATLDSFQIPDREKEQLLGLLSPVKVVVVETRR